ncbi:squalene/phytoene synthase family protein [Paenarthrobacter sp. Z7-10]|uniref:phytoene/squalene synthase family protein n=1 Tax=Paenarthrobacter sp. Z7-10 TaxID=2787635 RepID=UPI0022A8FB1B|nr:squalene/phytoene synthase family protein [Paenarthrobacter sp. Z7-10]MCZ2402231.1 squalene/phytoene synthase family protein [Paenarthrobacter sp. Z7-10]
MSAASTSSADLYDQVAAAAASVVIRRYSTSFGFAARLLRGPLRQHIENIYALVRIADEVVDGAAAARVDAAGVFGQLERLESECLHALEFGYSTNLVVHAFAQTARTAGFGPELSKPFFASMRSDLAPGPLGQQGFEQYVYGSAEVVGLMCLRAFLIGQPNPDAQFEQLQDGARRLGAAFQKINFLRDLAADFHDLKRSYFPGISPEQLTDAQKNLLLDDIDADLAISRSAITQLPATSRSAVVLAHSLFAELSRRTRRTPAQELLHRRIRVPNPVKTRLAAAAVLGQNGLSYPERVRS